MTNSDSNLPYGWTGSKVEAKAPELGCCSLPATVIQNYKESYSEREQVIQDSKASSEVLVFLETPYL